MSVEKKFDIINLVACLICIIIGILIATLDNHWADVYEIRESAEAALVAMQNIAIF